MIIWLTRIYYLVLLVSTIGAGFLYRLLDRVRRMICWFVFLGALTELLAYYWAKQYQNNYPVYNIAIIIELAVIYRYYKLISDSRRTRKLNAGIGYIGIVSGLFFLYLEDSLNKLNTNLICLEALMVIGISLISLYRKINSDTGELSLSEQPDFWCSCIFLLYQFGGLWSWGFYTSGYAEQQHGAVILDIAILLIGIFTYSALMTAILLTLKTRR